MLTKEAENLRQNLELKNRELVCNVSNIYTKNLVINKVAKSLQRSTANFKQSNMELVRDIISELKQNLEETSWREFEYRFARVHELFYDTLDAQFPNLTPAERKIAHPQKTRNRQRRKLDRVFKSGINAILMATNRAFL